MSEQLVSFVVGDHLYGIPVEQVQEVLPDRTATHVPLSSPEVAGLVNLRGQVVLSLDLRARLGLSACDPHTPRMMVVVRREDEPVSLVVDRIGDVASVEASEFEPPPQTLDPGLRPLILGAYKLDGRLLLALDVDAVVSQ
jgi:CheW protein